MPTTKPSKQRAAEQTVRYVTVTDEHKSLLPLIAAARISKDERYASGQRAAQARSDIVGAVAILMRGTTERGVPFVSLAIKPVVESGEVLDALFFLSVRWDGDEVSEVEKYFANRVTKDGVPPMSVLVKAWIDGNGELHVSSFRPTVHLH